MRRGALATVGFALLNSLALCSPNARGQTFDRFYPSSGGPNGTTELWGVSGDGRLGVGVDTLSSGRNVAAGRMLGQTVLWSDVNALLTFPPSSAYGASFDGSVVVGQMPVTSTSSHAFRRSSSGLEDLGSLASGSSQALAASADGSVVVGGSASRPNGRSAYEAFRWSNGVMQGLGDLPGGDYYSEARAVSADGSVIAGWSYGSSNTRRAFRWEGGTMAELPLFGQSIGSYASAITPDGTRIVGFCEGGPEGLVATMWTGSGVMSLGKMNGSIPTYAQAVSGDGSIVVGRTAVSGSEAIIWDQMHQWRPIRTMLLNDYGIDVGGMSLSEATGISWDGTTIVGRGHNEAGVNQAWMFTVPSAPSIGVVIPLLLVSASRRRTGSKAWR